MYYNDMCTVIVEGNITADLEVKVGTKSGTEYIMFSVANNQGPKDSKETIFFQCWVFGSEACQKMMEAGFKKGSRVRVTGNMAMSTYQKNDENKTVVTIPKVTVYDCKYVSYGSKADNKDASAAGAENSDLPTDPSATEGTSGAVADTPPESIPDTLQCGENGLTL